MNCCTAKRLTFLFMIVFFLFILSSCGTTGGGVGYEWGQEAGNGHHHKAKKGGPPPHAPAHGYRAKYKYRYYPSAGVYYDTYRELYFYLQGSNWRVSASLPLAKQWELGEYVNIEMDSDKPYTDYEKHKGKYPPGQYKKKGKKKNK